MLTEQIKVTLSRNKMAYENTKKVISKRNKNKPELNEVTESKVKPCTLKEYISNSPVNESDEQELSRIKKVAKRKSKAVKKILSNKRLK